MNVLSFILNDFFFIKNDFKDIIFNKILALFSLIYKYKIKHNESLIKYWLIKKILIKDSMKGENKNGAR